MSFEAIFSINRKTGEFISSCFQALSEDVDHTETNLVSNQLYRDILARIAFFEETNDQSYISYSWTSQPADGFVHFDVEVLTWDDYTIDIMIST